MLCEVKLKWVEYVGSQHLEHAFTPPTLLAKNLHDKITSGSKQKIDNIKASPLDINSDTNIIR